MNDYNETTYLFARHKRDLYKEHLETLTQSECLFSRQITLYLNHMHEPEKMPLFSKHLLGCRECQKKLEASQGLYYKLAANIPYKESSQRYQSSISARLSEVNNILMDKKTLRRKLKRKFFFSTLSNWLVDMTVHTIGSRTFIKGMMMAIVAYALIAFML